MDNRITNKIQNVKRDTEGIISNICKEKFWIDYYGAYHINPDNVFIGFESQETVDKESGGDWYLHFK